MKVFHPFKFGVLMIFVAHSNALGKWRLPQTSVGAFLIIKNTNNANQ